MRSLLLALACTACAATEPGTDERIPPTLENARLYVPDDAVADENGRIPLAIHFQGGTGIAIENFGRMERGGVLIASELSGFSSAFREPYEDPAAFARLLADGEALVSAKLGREVTFDPILISFFSAGYGAVRELLKHDEHFDRIDTLVSADSIYASVAAEDVRAPRADQMFGFCRFAQEAAAGRKTFVLVHGMYPTDYASTAECADFILASVAGTREPSTRTTRRGVEITSEFHARGFHLYTVDRADPDVHVECLHMIGDLAREHAR